MKQADVDHIIKRARMKCENPQCLLSLMYGCELHHIYWKSQYKGADRDEPWNIAAICHKCHYSIHSQANTSLDKYLKKEADLRKPKAHRSTEKDSSLDRAKTARKREYRRKIELFKQSHGGLSPTQYQYRKNKEYKR